MKEFVMKLYVMLLSLGLLMSYGHLKLVADIQDADQVKKSVCSNYWLLDENEDDLPDLDALRDWEEENPPSFTQITRTLVKDHVSKNKVGYCISAVGLLALGYCFRQHLSNHKYKYLFGTAATLTFAGLYGKHQFDKVMNKTRKALRVDIMFDDVDDALAF